MSRSIPVVVILGPTGSGKSAVALSLAKMTRGEIVNADSRQIYRYLNVGTSKPDIRETAGIKHHLYDFLDPRKTYNAAEYAQDAAQIIEQILARGLAPIIVGGTGLYIRALFEGFSPMPAKDPELRKKLLAESSLHGRKYLHDKLAALDPKTAAKIPFQNIQRVVRALEVCAITGQPLSRLHAVKAQPATNRAPRFYGLRWNRTEIKARLTLRTEKIVPEIVRETEWLIKNGYGLSDPGLQSLGYARAVDYLQGRISREELARSVITETLQYAKRQMTWFNKTTDVRWIDCAEPFDPGRTADTIARDMI